MTEKTPPASRSGSKAETPGRGKKVATGVAFGIGSAAIVAALLYAKNVKSKDKD